MRIMINVPNIQKISRINKLIKSSSWYERYQADTVELDSEITEVNKNPHRLTIVDHFSKYGFAYPIKDKKEETIRDHISQAFIIENPSMFRADKGKEFVNNTLSLWIENRGIRHVRGGNYHPQSQGVVESFNKTIQRFLNKAFTNSIFNWEENKCSLPLMITDFLIIITSTNIQQLRWHQVKFYFITKIIRWLKSNYKYREI